MLAQRSLDRVAGRVYVAILREHERAARAAAASADGTPIARACCSSRSTTGWARSASPAATSASTAVESACRVRRPQADALLVRPAAAVVDRCVHVPEREPKPEGGLAADETEMESVGARKPGSTLAGSNGVLLVPQMRFDHALRRLPTPPRWSSPVWPSSLVPRVCSRAFSQFPARSSTSASQAR